LIKTLKIETKSNQNYQVMGAITSSSLERIALKQNETYTGGFIIKTLSQCENEPLGDLIIYWKRLEYSNDDSRPYNQLKFNFNSINIEDRPFEIEFMIKDLAEYGELVPLNLKFRNNTGNSQKIQINLIDTEGFLISGDIKKFFELRHEEVGSFLFNVLPMGVGKKKLPGIQFVCLSMENKVIWDSSGTRFLTVIPKKI